MKKYSKIIVYLISILCLGYYLPYGYELIFGDYIRNPFVVYSSLEKDFFFYKNDNKDGLTIVDTKENRYEQEELDSLLPLFNFRQLLQDGKMPKTIQGIPISNEDFQKWNYHLRFNPNDIKKPTIELYSLLESESGRVKLKMPDDFFRIKDKIEFIVTKTNEVDIKKSILFQQEFDKLGFKFPAYQAYGNPTARKRYDLGYFITDADHQLYHLMMKKGMPYLKKVELPADTTEIAHLLVTEQASRAYFCVMIDQKGGIYYLQTSNYKWIKMPVPFFDVNNSRVNIMGNPLYHTIRISNYDTMNIYAIRKDYSLEKSYQLELEKWGESPSGKAMSYILPFETKFYRSGSSFINIHIDNIHVLSIALNVILALLLFILQKKFNKDQNVILIASICFTGIYGFISALFIYPFNQSN